MDLEINGLGDKWAWSSHGSRAKSAQVLIKSPNPTIRQGGLEALIQIVQRKDNFKEEAAKILFDQGNDEQKKVAVNVFYEAVMNDVFYANGFFELEVTAFVRVIRKKRSDRSVEGYSDVMLLAITKKYQAESYIYNDNAVLLALNDELSRDCGMPSYQ